MCLFILGHAGGSWPEETETLCSKFNHLIQVCSCMINASEGCHSDYYAGVPCMEDELDANEIST